MRKLQAVLAMGLLFCHFCCAVCFAIPDPRDSVIIESKTVSPGAGHPAVRLKIFITNKDTLAGYNLCLIERSLTGGAYMTLTQPKTYDSVVVHLTSTLKDHRILNPNVYNNSSPDSISIAGFSIANMEPPNAVRKAFLEIKFDTVRSNVGTIEFDSLRIVTWNGQRYVVSATMFANVGGDIPVTFVKGVVTVESPPPPPPPPCDISRDGILSATDVVLAINCIFTGGPKCGYYSTPARLVMLLNELFENPEITLIPPPSCD